MYRQQVSLCYLIFIFISNHPYNLYQVRQAVEVEVRLVLYPQEASDSVVKDSHVVKFNIEAVDSIYG